MDSRFSKLGTQGVRFHPQLTQCISVWHGNSGEGKSSLLQSCSDAFIVNTDLSSTSCPDPKAFIWPSLNEGGQPVESDGAVVSDFTWEEAMERINIVRDMAREGVEGAPRMVVIDTIDTAIRLVMDKVVADHGKTEWEDLFGPSAWAAVYDEFLDLAFDNRKAGLGTAFVAHLTTKVLTEGEGRSQKKVVLENVPRITDNFWGRLNDICEICGVVEQRLRTVSEEVEKVNSKTGEPIVSPKTGNVITHKVSRKVPEVVVSFEPRYKGVAKRRSGIQTSVAIPHKDGWLALEEAYQQGLKLEEAATS